MRQVFPLPLHKHRSLGKLNNFPKNTEASNRQDQHSDPGLSAAPNHFPIQPHKEPEEPHGIVGSAQGPTEIFRTCAIYQYWGETSAPWKRI